MKLGPNGLMIEDFTEFERFINALNLSGVIRLNEDLKDNQDKVLIRSDIAIKQSQVDKLKEIRGAFPETFDVKLSNDLVQRMAEHLTAAVEDYVNETPLFRRLYEEPGKKAFRYVLNAFKHTRTATSAFIIKQKNPEHFEHLATLGALALGIALHQATKPPRLHTNAFRSAFFSELPFANPALMAQAYDDPPRLRELAEKAAIFASRLDAPTVVLDCIRQTPSFSELTGEVQSGAGSSAYVDSKDIDTMGNVLFFDDQTGPSAEEAEGKDDGLALPMLVDILKFARYLTFLFRNLAQSEHLAEEISTRSAYNARKGYFHQGIVQAVLDIFREYEIEFRSLIKIAEVERRCLYPPSAWAYPKPLATQIVCQNHVLHCPKLKSGWDLHVVSTQEAFGWIGASLEAGRYHKCELEDELKRGLPR